LFALHCVEKLLFKAQFIKVGVDSSSHLWIFA